MYPRNALTRRGEIVPGRDDENEIPLQLQSDERQSRRHDANDSVATKLSKWLTCSAQTIQGVGLLSAVLIGLKAIGSFDAFWNGTHQLVHPNGPHQVDHTNSSTDSNNEDILVFTINNHGFVPMAQNWILHAQSAEVNRFKVICTDRQCFDELSIWMNSTEHLELMEFEELNSKKMSWGQKDYSKYTQQRPQIVQAMYAGHFMDHNLSGILYLDSDMVIVRNFLSMLHSEQFADRDVVMQLDGGNADCSREPGTGGFCTCFLFTPFDKARDHNIRLFLNRWEKHCDAAYRNANDQSAMGTMLRAEYGTNESTTSYRQYQNLSIGILDCHQFPSGLQLQANKMKNWAMDKLMDKNDDSIKVLHSNYMGGYGKKESWFKKVGHWWV